MKRISARSLMAASGAALVVAVLGMSTPAWASPSAKASPSKNLTNGKVIKISGKGWPANDSLVIVECNGSVSTGLSQSDCNITTPVAITASKTGAIKGSFTFMTGAVGNGTCNAGQTCYIAVSEPVTSPKNDALIAVTVSKKA